MGIKPLSFVIVGVSLALSGNVIRQPFKKQTTKSLPGFYTGQQEIHIRLQVFGFAGRLSRAKASF
jgi:hypothetical protein